MKYLVCGDRNWKDSEKIESFLKSIIFINPNSTLSVGGCSGADKIAEQIGKSMGFNIIIFNAKWNLYGKAAGPMRNIEMLNQSPDLVVAFHSNIESSKGTKHTVKVALERNIKVLIIE